MDGSVIASGDPRPSSTRLELDYRSLFENAIEGIFVSSPQGRYLEVNRALAQMLGYESPKELIESITDIAGQVYVDRERRRFFQEQLETDGYIRSFEAEFRRKDGSHVWVRTNARVVRNVDGAILYYEGSNFEVTEEKWAGKALRDSEERYRQLVELSPDAIFIQSEGKFVFANSAAVKLYGFSRRDELLGRNVMDFVHEKYRAIVLSRIQQLRSGRPQVEAIEGLLRRDDGTTIEVEVEAASFNYEGSPAALVMMRDISQRKEAERAQRGTQERLRKSEAFYSSLVENLPQYIFRKDVEGRFTFANQRFCDSLKRGFADIQGKTDFDLYPWDLAQKYQSDDRRILASGETFEAIEEHQPPGEQKQFVQVFKTPVYDDNGQAVGLQGIFWDITEKRTLEEQLRHAQKMESIGQLAGGLAHDFNNILMIIQGHATLLGEIEELPVEAVEATKQINFAAERASALTRQLLMFSRRQAIQRRSGDLNKIVSNLGKMLERLLPENVNLETILGPSLPPILMDSGMIEQALLNLAVNARDAMPAGGKLIISTAAVEIENSSAIENPETSSGMCLTLKVADTGCGISPENMKRIFEPFFTTKEVGKGTGLGLATVYGIVKQHKGWINVESEVGNGALFTIFLPVNSDGQAEALDGASPPAPVRGHETILVVEDETHVRELVVLILRRQGYKTFSANSARDALVLWRMHQNEIDLLLTDIVMPGGMSGKQLAEQLLQERPSLKVLFTSGYDPEALEEDCPLEEGINFLRKPYHPRVLAQAIRKRLDNH